MQLSRLLIFSACVSFLLFLALDYISNTAIDHYFQKTQYIEKHDNEKIHEMQDFIDNQSIGSQDSERLWEWAKQNKIVYLQIIKNNFLIFDSKFPNQELWEDEIKINNFPWDEYFTVLLADGEVHISIISLYSYQFYNYAFISEIIVCFCMFIFLVLLGIRKKMDYIAKLSDEIDILKGGSLDYSITVKGNDEIAALANGLENMRLSFYDLIQKEGEMVRENQRMITEMSHDLRTPVTSIILYTEILKKDAYKDSEHQKLYLEKIELKARRLKQLTDHLFEYALVARNGENDIELENAEWIETLFYDAFSEMIAYLEQNGFIVNFSMQWPKKKICISTEWIIRIMDNITSNIIKYADKNEPVYISFVNNEAWVGLKISNSVSSKTNSKEVESNGIGIQSMKNMMHQMGGECKIIKQKNNFEVILLFPFKF
ncbi:MAG: HAMP domain-containing sensor histidine kinase [Peptococcaceae bacterium]|nr:HAMP domain-containing sensor histidine kinase [Peptococcaceae bacterium]